MVLGTRDPTLIVGPVYAPLLALEAMLGDLSNTRVYLSLLCGY